MKMVNLRVGVIVLGFGLFCCCALPASAQNGTAASEPPASSRTATGLDKATKEQVFEIVWSRINDFFFDPKFNGVDWGLMRRKYQPRAIQTTTDAAFYEVLSQMLGELKQSHVGIIPPEAYGEEEARVDAALKSGDTTPGTTGMTVQLVEGQPTVTRLISGSGGEKAGIRTGYIITAVDGKPTSNLLGRLKTRANSDLQYRTLVGFTLTRLMDGPVGSEITLGVRDAEDKEQTVKIVRTPQPGKVSRFGQLPPLSVEVESRRLNQGIGYIRANIFLMPILNPIQAAIKQFKDAPGIIVDLRGNPGGIGILAPTIAATFYSKPTNLGTMRLRKGFFNFLANPQPKVNPTYKKPVIILTDEMSASTSEILAGGMQETKRAVVVGATTAGQVLPSVVELLPGGARFQFAQADFKTPKGILLEGRGVKPDIPVTGTRSDFLAGRDPALEAAVSHILNKRGVQKP